MPDSHSGPFDRTVFFVSDGTGITAETLGHSVLTQFGDLRYRPQRLPFVDSPEKARDAAVRINEAGERDGKRAYVDAASEGRATDRAKTVFGQACACFRTANRHDPSSLFGRSAVLALAGRGHPHPR